jgi:hypothetical protein
MFAHERRTPSTHRNDVADEPSIEEKPRPGYGLGEAHVVADLHDRSRCPCGGSQASEVGQRPSTRLLDEHGLSGLERAER